MHLLLALVLCRGAVYLIDKNQMLICYSVPLQYTMNTAERFLSGGLSRDLGLGILAVAWLETRVNLRPWVKRVLRLSGPLFLMSLLLPLVFNHATNLESIGWLEEWHPHPHEYY